MTVDPEEQPENPLEPDKPAAPDADPPEGSPDAEPDEVIEGPGDDDAQEVPDAPPEPSSIAVTQDQEKKLEAEARRHENRLREILGGLAPLAVMNIEPIDVQPVGDQDEDGTSVVHCPLCNPLLRGYLYSGDLAHPVGKVQEKLVIALAEDKQVQYVQGTGLSECEECKGLGMVLTGSRVPGAEKVACRKCSGFGYLPPPTGAQNGVATPSDIPAELVTVPAGGIREDEDNWHVPRLLPDGRDNPNYGRQPQYWDHNYPTN